MKKIVKKIGDCIVLINLTIVPVFLIYQIYSANQKIAILEEKISKLPVRYTSDSVGGVGYISAKDGNEITVPGYGKFLLNDAEAEVFHVGDKVPSYVLKRGD
ncbi:DUF1372 family protein [Streptococcus phocae subsp. salmonis]|uniref:DUF1372 family protein n=1 Tax=Streptococcus phocae TaxID=119224 RepID=UPI0005318D77|nr:DUF1372 family protein [Streptococcus phocae]KGR72881.1 hypothetical protein NX86_03900 [Streptococcus phocae subsp. salmonis]